jgi:serine O-acetyltransferase
MTFLTNSKIGAGHSPVSPLDQIRYMAYELGLIVNRHWWRWITCWFGGGAGVIVSYRLDRFCYLLFGKSWAGLRILLFPVFLILRMLSYSHEIHYAARIGKGLKILHPSLGVVVTDKVIAGEHLILVGGNCIGGRKQITDGEFIIGDDVLLGVNAVVLGPLKLGNGVQVAPSSLVVESFSDNAVVAGVPAKVIRYLTASVAPNQ